MEPPESFPFLSLLPAQEAEARALIRGGSLIGAIKIVRNATGSLLREAKDLCEGWREQMIRDGEMPAPMVARRIPEHTMTPPLQPLLQGTILTVALGDGAVQLCECSNVSALTPFPRLTQMLPARPAYGDAAAEAAASLQLTGDAVYQLYVFLHDYYRRSGKALTP